MADGLGPSGRLWRIAFVVILILVIVGSLVPPAAASAGSGIPDWAQHGIAYGLLMATLLACQARKRYLASAAVLIGVGAALELVQGLLGYRAAEWRDLAADAVGIAAAGAALSTRLALQVRRRSGSEPTG